MEEQYYEVYAYVYGADVFECETFEEARTEAERIHKQFNCQVVITKVEKESHIYF